MTLHIVLWKWKQEGFRANYTSTHVNYVADMLKRNMDGIKDWRIVCVTDNGFGIEKDVDVHPLWSDHSHLVNASGKHLPSCYRRLRLFDPQMQTSMGIKQGDRICSLDLDMVVTGPLDEVLGKKERFVGWVCRGYYHARVFNGSLFMFNAGDLSHIWREFNPDSSPKLCVGKGFMGSDQAWLSYKLTPEHWTFGWQWPQVASYPREVRRMRVLDRRTRIIFFHGGAKPWDDHVQKETPWVHRYWKVQEATA